jgi:hypothetical protein
MRHSLLVVAAMSVTGAQPVPMRPDIGRAQVQVCFPMVPVPPPPPLEHPRRHINGAAPLSPTT